VHAAVSFLGRRLGKTPAAAATVSAPIPWLATGSATTADQPKGELHLIFMYYTVHRFQTFPT